MTLGTWHEGPVDDAIDRALNGPPLYMVMVYYHRPPGFINEDGLPAAELYSAPGTEAEALADAKRASERDEHTYAVEGGHHEVGGWENPVFRGGVQLR